MDTASFHWFHASSRDLRTLEIIQKILCQRSDLLFLLFHPNEASLRATPRELLRQCESLCRSDFILIKLCLDLWNESGEVGLMELCQYLDKAVFGHIMSILAEYKQ